MRRCTNPSKEEPVLAMHRIVKRFGGVCALGGANFNVQAGTIHGLVGQNGAGKSTLIKILAGIHQPDAGSIEIAGQRYNHLSPHRADRLGLHFIHQERLLVPTFTVGEALFLGSEPGIGPLPLLNRRRMRRQAAETIQNYFGVQMPLGALIGELTPAQQQIVQITRALLRHPSVLVFDEPTAALVKPEADRLFESIQRLRGQGLTIVYISHYLNEIAMLCDRVTVLRNGVDVGTVNPREVPTSALVSMIVARDIDEMFPKKVATIGEPILTVKNLCRRRAFMDVSFTVRRGEIVGITGLVGSGVKELVRSLFGLIHVDGGKVALDGNPVRLRSPAAAVRRRLALVPENRREHGIALDLSVRENVTLASLRQYSRFGFLQLAREARDVDELISRLSVRTPHRDTAARHLSGGNQQKVALAKWLSRRSSLYLLDEPTVGVDIGSKVEIYRLIGELAEEGAGILTLSADLLELLGICDRILVMYRGRIAREFAAARTNSDELLACATGADLTALPVNK
jgi:ribose transport system ATP-binding protein